jgi:hypothetical protein
MVVDGLMKVFQSVLLVFVQQFCLVDKHVHVLLDSSNQIFLLLLSGLENVPEEKGTLLEEGGSVHFAVLGLLEL